MNLNIILGQGLGEIQFGMTKQNIIESLGLPNKEYQTDDENNRLQYFDYRIELSLECNNNKYRLGWIEVHNKKALLFDKQLIGEKKVDVLHYLEKFIGNIYEEVDYNSFIAILYDKYELELQFEFGTLQNINFGNFFDENDNPIYKFS
jgi:hypothetical protein